MIPDYVHVFDPVVATRKNGSSDPLSWIGNRPVLVVAPHLCFPERNGADILVERTSRFLSQHAGFVDLIGCRAVRRYRAAVIVDERPVPNRLRPQWLAGIRCLARRSHYLLERFNTPVIERVIRQQWDREDYGIVLASYLVTLPMLPPLTAAQRLFVWTHNDEFKWFEDLRRFSRNPLRKAVASQSLRWLHHATPRLAEGATLLHVSEEDRRGFDRMIPGHRNLVVPVGTDMASSPRWQEVAAGGPVVLTFMGSLSVQMAGDALQHFHEHYEPALREAFGSRLSIRVVGSQPTRIVKKLCRVLDWKLHADVTDDALSALLSESTFTILPFPYATGVKLKLMRSLGNGIPFLATSVTKSPGFKVPPGCCFADEPAEWVASIQQWLASPDKPALRRELLAVAESYSWPTVVKHIATAIRQAETPRLGTGSIVELPSIRPSVRSAASPPLVHFLFAGSTKAGTTSIYEAFRQHPQVVTTKAKEPHYFSRGIFGPNYVGIGEDVADLAEYRRHFPKATADKKIGDFDVMTLHGPDAVRLIKEVNSRPKIMLVLRNPIERAYSHYLMDVRECMESRSFGQALKEDYAKYRAGSNEYCAVVRLGFYADRIELFRREFGPDNIRIWLYDDLCRDSGQVLEEMCSFLEIDAAPMPDLDRIWENEAGVPRSRLSSVILRARSGILKRPRKLYLKLPRWFRRYVRHHFLIRTIKTPAMPDDARSFLLEIYKNDILRLEGILGRDLTHWLRDPDNPMSVPAEIQKMKQARFFDQVADEEYEIERPHGAGRLYEWSIRMKFEMASRMLSFPLRDGSLLDVCCGSGMSAEYFARAGATVTGVDISSRSVTRAKERVKRHGFTASFEVGDAEALPYADRSFDVVAVHDGLHLLANPHGALVEMTRVARRAVIVIEPALSWLTQQAVAAGFAVDFEEAGNYVYRLREDEIFAIVRRTGFERMRHRQYLLYYHHEPFPWARHIENTPLFHLFPFGFAAASLLAPRLGNKLCVVCER